MLDSEASNRCFCTPPDIDDGLDTGANKQEVKALASSVPWYTNTSSGFHRPHSLSVFSSSSSDDGDINGFTESDIDVDISGIV